MTTRKAVMQALSIRWANSSRVIGAARFKWFGIGNERLGHVVIGPRGVVDMRNWSEVESAVASMIAAYSSVARVL